jgi:hypothetical protein
MFQRHNRDFPIKPAAFVIRQILRGCMPLRQGVARRGDNCAFDFLSSGADRLGRVRVRS